MEEKRRGAVLTRGADGEVAEGGEGLDGEEDEAAGREVAQGPLERVVAALALVDGHHNLLLRRRRRRLRGHDRLLARRDGWVETTLEQSTRDNEPRLVASASAPPVCLKYKMYTPSPRCVG